MGKKNQIKTECNGCEFNCKIDAALAPGNVGAIQRYYPTIGGETYHTYTQNKKTKAVPFLGTRAGAIQYGIKIAKLCSLNTKKH